MRNKRCAGRLAMTLALLIVSSLLCTLLLNYTACKAESRALREVLAPNVISRTASMSVPAETEKEAAYRPASAIHTDYAERMQKAILFCAAGYLPAWFAPRDGRRGTFAFFKIAGMEGFPDYGIVMKC